MANLRRFDEVSPDGSWYDPFAPDVNGGVYNPNDYTPPNPPPTQTPPPPAGGGTTPTPPSVNPAIANMPAGSTQAQKNQVVLDDWINWIGATPYSSGASDRGAGFQGGAGGQDLGKVVDAYNASHPGANAKLGGGKSNDLIDFGFGPVDVRTSGGDWWYDAGGVNNPAGSTAMNGAGSDYNGQGSTPGFDASRFNQWGAPVGSPDSYRPANPWSMQQFMGQEAPVANKADYNDIMSALKSLFPNGALNQDIINRQTENARENLGRQRKSQDATDRAILASRGTLGSGPELTAMSRNNQNIADQYQNAVSGIYANEENAASQRMISALQTAAGMSESDAKNLIDAYMAQTERGLGLGSLGNAQTKTANDFTLGQGNLALGNMNGVNNYNLGLAQYGLDRDKTLMNADQNQFQNVVELLKLGYSLDDILANGYVPRS